MTVDVTDVATLIKHGHLNDVRFLEFSGSVRDTEREDLSADDVEQALTLSLRKNEETIEFRVSIEVETRMCSYSATAATQVNVREAAISEDVLPEFAPRIGFNVVYPYLREAIHSASARLRLENVVIPLVDPNMIRMSGGPVLAGAETE